jgi:hypothetical protein
VIIYGAAVAAVLIAVVAYYYMPTLAGATQAQAEYAALRDAAPALVLSQDGKSVHICINSTAPQRVLVQKSGVWTDAHRDCRIDSGGRCVPAAHGGSFCRWYLGRYEVGDNVTVVLKAGHASVVKSYRIAAIAPSAKLGVGGATGGLNAAGSQNGAQVVTVTMTGTVYSITTATVTTTATSHSTTTVTVTAPAATVTHTVIIQDPSFTTTRTVAACVPDTTTTTTTPRLPPIEFGRHGFQPPSAATSTVASYTTIYTTSYVTSTATTTIWTTSTVTYTPTVTTTVTRLRPGVEVTCYICRTPTPTTTCRTTTLATTTSTTTIAGGSGFAQPNTPNRGSSIDALFLGLSAAAMMASSAMLAKKR